MKTKYDVVITEEDCSMGVRNNERLCVVSTAIARLQPEATRIETNINTIRFSLSEDGKTYRLAYRTPAVVQAYIRAFDDGAEAKPMKFVLDNPQVVEKVPAPKQRAKTPSFRPQEPAKTRRSVRVFGEKSFRAVKP